MGNTNLNLSKSNDLSIKVTPDGITANGTLHITLNDMENRMHTTLAPNERFGDQNKSLIVKLSDGSTYIEPNLTEQVPSLLNYCKKSITQDEYYCDNLYRVLFKCANHHNSNKKNFRRVTDGIARSNIQYDISYYTKELLGHKKNITDVIQVCHDIENVCTDFLNDTHPLKKQLLKMQEYH